MYINQIDAKEITQVSQDFLKKVEFTRIPNVAQYGGSDYSNVVRVERGISLEQAKAIAAEDREIDYFVYLKGIQMVLPLQGDIEKQLEQDEHGLIRQGAFIYDNGTPGYDYFRLFQHGDVVFFKKDGRWLGSAPGFADVYEKR